MLVRSRSAFSGLEAVVVLVVLTLMFLLSFTCMRSRSVDHEPASDTSSSEETDPGHYARQFGDDSGYSTARTYRLLPPDPLSFEQIRASFADAGQRGIQELERAAARGDLPPPKRMELLMSMARLHLYQGENEEGARVLKQARMLAESDPPLFSRILTTLLFMQGVAALRRGETENCVECQCQGSCIFPLTEMAIHQRRSGSEEAIDHFMEVLRYHPDDVGARWLLNLAHMTIGSYPGKVPPQYLIPLDPFQSELTIGRFTDVAPRLGLNRFNQAGGAIMEDFDNDGLLDLVMTSQDVAKPMHLYRNKGDGTFEERSKAAGLSDQLGGLHCVQTDYNNDGFKDIYVCRGGWSRVPQKHSLLRNNGNGTFTDVTREAGLLHPIDGQVAVWADYDNDGHLDLFVGGETTRSRLYHNKGDGTFEEVAEAAGVANIGMFCKGASWCDFDGDGYPDLYVSNFRGYASNPHAENRLFRNNRDGTFTDVAPQFGLTRPGGFACWFFDYDNDGWPDIFATTYEYSLDDIVNCQLGRPHKGQTCRLYRNLEGKGFADVTAAVGLDLAVCPMGCNFADFDNDGFLDIYLGTGNPDYSMLVPNRMFKNVDGKRFVDITTSSGTGHLQKGHSVCCGDWKRDGKIDLFVMLGGATPGDQFRNALFMNPGNDNHWLTVKLVGRKTNRSAIGARIKATPAGDPQRSIYRHVTSGSSFGANPLQQTIGLGKADRVATLEILWPTSRTTQVFHDVAVDQAIEITEFEKEFRPLHWSKLPAPRMD